MPAKTKDALLAATLEEYGKLDAVIAHLSYAEAAAKDQDDTSIKDVVGHRAHWIGLFLGWHEDGLAGRKWSFRRQATNGTSSRPTMRSCAKPSPT